MTARLPIIGGDDDTWGQVLNTFLETSHNGDGTLQTGAIQQAGGVTKVNGKSPSNGAVALTAGDVGAAGTASPAFTGTPTAPTASPGTDNTQLATTAYVEAAAKAYSSPMTSAGDMIIGGSSPAGTPERLGIGSSGQVMMTRSSGIPGWENAEGISIDAFGADPTGTNDSTAAFNAALAMLPVASNGLAYGKITGSAGTYKFNSSGAQTSPIPPGVSVEFAGKWSTMIMDHGAGDCFLLQNPIPGSGTWPTINGWGGGIKGCTIDGANNAGDSGTGLHIADGVGWDIDVAVQNYTGASGAGIRQHSYMWWTLAYSRVIINNCTQGYLYDCSDGPAYTVTSASYTAGSPNVATYITSAADGWTVPGFPSVPLTAGMLMYGDQSTLLTPHSGSGSTSTSTMTVYSVTTTTAANDTLTCHYTTGSASGTTGTLTVANSTASHQGGELDLWIHQNATQDGLVFANGSNASNGVFRVNGSWIGQGTQPSSAVVRLTGVIPAGHAEAGVGSILTSSQVSVWAEHDSGTYGPYTIYFGQLYGQNTWLGNTGLLWFQGMTASNVDPVAYSGIFRHFGPIIGDATLSPGSPTGTTEIIGVTGGLMLAQGHAGSGTLHPLDGDFFDLGTLSGNVTISMNQATSAPQRKTIKATQAASGGPYTITWPSNASPTTSSPTVLWPGGTAPVMSSAPGAEDFYMIETIDGATWVGRAVQATPSSPFLCTPIAYAPGTQATPSTSSDTMSAVDSANISTGSFKAPSSGSVLVSVSLVAGFASGSGVIVFGLAAHGTVSPVLGSEFNFKDTAGSTCQRAYAMDLLVTGLTPGTSYDLDLMFASPGGGTLAVYAYGSSSTTPSASTQGAPVTMAVRAV